MNGFPSSFLDFLNILHQKYRVTKAELEDEKWLKHPERSMLTDLRRGNIIGDKAAPKLKLQNAA